MDALRRGELAKRCGVNIETLRYYEKRKLFDPPPRSSTGYRLYPESAVSKIRFIKNAQKLGFTLKEIKALLKLRVEPGKPCESVLNKARDKLEEVDGKIAGLKSMRKVLGRLIDRCERTESTSDCPILACFESGEEF